VYLFVRDGMTQSWAQQAYVKASNTGFQDQFGSSVALSDDGDTLAVGTWGERSSGTGVNGDETDNSALNAGAAYVLVRDVMTEGWTQQAYIKASNTATNDQFAISLSLSGDGNVLAVGAAEEDSGAVGVNGNQADNSADRGGAAYVFLRNESTTSWSQQAYIKASDTDVLDLFGWSVALSGDSNTLAVGARQAGVYLY
jgi:hypothetical protein